MACRNTSLLAIMYDHEDCIQLFDSCSYLGPTDYLLGESAKGGLRNIQSLKFEIFYKYSIQCYVQSTIFVDCKKVFNVFIDFILLITRRICRFNRLNLI